MSDSRKDDNYNNKKKVFHSSTTEILKDLPLVSELESPITEILNFYHRSDEQVVKQAIIGDETDPLQIGKKFATVALEQTRILLPNGRGNVYEDIMATQGQSLMKANFVRDMFSYSRMEDSVKTAVQQKYFNIAKKEFGGKFNDTTLGEVARQLMGLLVRPHISLYYQAGRCNEYAFIALQCLLEMKMKLGKDFTDIVKSINVMRSGKPHEHVFLEIAIKAKNDLTSTLICDPWAGFIGEIGSIPKDFYVTGKQALGIYNSPNKAVLLSNDIINYAYTHMTYLDDKNATCFTMYQDSIEGKLDDPYSQYLHNLPKELSIEYQHDTSFQLVIGRAEPIDYKKSSTDYYQMLKERYQDSEVIPRVFKLKEGGTEYYSQPDHPEITLSLLSPPQPNQTNNFDQNKDTQGITRVETNEPKPSDIALQPNEKLTSQHEDTDKESMPKSPFS